MRLNLKYVSISLIAHLVMLATPITASAVETITEGSWVYGTEVNKRGVQGAVTTSVQYKNMAIGVFCNTIGKMYFVNVSFRKGQTIADGDVYLDYQVDNGRINKIKLLIGDEEKNILYVQKKDIDVFLADLIRGNRVKFKWIGAKNKEVQYPVFSLIGSNIAIKTALSQCYGEDEGFTSGKDQGFIDSSGNRVKYKAGENVF